MSDWLSETIYRIYGIRGRISAGSRVTRVRYAKSSSITLINKRYHKNDLVYLKRKYVKIQIALDTVSKEYAGMLKQVNRHA
jgi:hypothetical protein